MAESYFYQCLNTETSTQSNKGYTTETLSILLWDALDRNHFYFLFLLFSDFIGNLFLFFFSFLLDDKEARDIAVT